MLQDNYSTKIILSGKRLEVITYEKEIQTNRVSYGGRRFHYLDQSDHAIEHRKISYSRAISRFKRLVHCNFVTDSCFLTLTFNNSHKKLPVTVDGYKLLFNRFMKKLRRNYPCIKHIAVIEFQSDHELDGLHFHVILNDGYLPYQMLVELWIYGHLWIKRVDTSTLDQLVSYMSKAIHDPRLYGKRFYLRSNNLDQPKVLTGIDADYTLQDINFEHQRLIRSDSFQSNHFGVIEQEEYELQENALTTLTDGIRNN